MSQPMLQQRITATPRKKIVLIAVLAVTLVTVIVLQLPESKPAAQQPEADRARSRQEIAQNKSNAKSQSESTVEPSPGTLVKSWPRIPLETVLQKDPFALPEWARVTTKVAPNAVSVSDDTSDDTSEAHHKQLAILETLKQQGVSMVILDGDRKVAKLGTHEIRVGDEISGFRVVEINMDGIVLEARAVE